VVKSWRQAVLAAQEEKTMLTTTLKRISPALVLVGTLATGCGEDPPGLYITMWSGAFSSIQVGQEAKHSIQLSQVPVDKVYVDVENTYPDIAFVDPMTLSFKDKASGQVTIKGLKVGKVTLTFKLRENGHTRPFSFEVVDQATTDFGIAPDRGKPDSGPPAPDTSTPAPDTAPPAPDTAASPG
jgi:hypothetical protein